MVGHWHLENIDWLCQITAEQHARLRAAAELLELSKGEQVFGPAPKPADVFILKSGRIRIYRESADAEQVTFGYVKPGEVFGECALFDGQSRESTAVAMEKSTVLKVKREVFIEIVRADPEIGFAIGLQIEERFKNVETRLEDLVFRNARQRLASALLMLAEQFGEQRDGRTFIPIQVTQAELATLIGTSRPTASLMLGDFMREGIVEKQGRMLGYVDLPGLKQSVQDQPAH